MKQPQRNIAIQHNNGQPDTILELGKAVNVLNSGDKEFIYLEKMDNGKWRLTFSSMFEDFASIEQLKIVRDVTAATISTPDNKSPLPLFIDAAKAFEEGQTVLVEVADSNGRIYNAAAFSKQYGHKSSDLLSDKEHSEKGKWFILP